MYRKILITGGTGSLGTALVKDILEKFPGTEITILARNETKMSRALAKTDTNVVKGIIGDVRDRDTLTTIFPGHDLIIHAAAIKIVPVAESDPVEAFKTNVLGSLNVAQAAVESGVKRVVGISTDKACGPTYYGQTKRLMEGIFRQASLWGETEFVLCRYGNVLRSANSIVPLFERQSNEGTPFTITDLRMTRFWLSMEDAVNLIWTTVELAIGGQIFVPMAPVMSIVDLAKTINPDNEIIEIGIRPGERLHETLLIREESMHTRQNNQYKMFIIDPPWKPIDPEVHNLPFQHEYTSDSPDHWLSPDEMREMLSKSPDFSI